jgi:hypothetical protein
VAAVVAVAAEVPREEPDRVAELRPRDAQVPAGIGVEGLVRRSEQVEEREAVVSREQLVIPLL